MAKSAAFTFTNTTAGTNTVTPLALNLPQNYALTQDSADVAVLSNKTAAIDAAELVSFRSRKWNWKPSPKVEILNPSPVQTGMEYSMQLEDVLVITDSADASYRVDEPIICTVSFRHNKNGLITNSVVGTVFLRAISALMKSNGTWRFEDLMRSAERPVDA
jgi:hypothetical protein